MDRPAPPHALYAPGREGTAAWGHAEREKPNQIASEMVLYAPPRNAPPPAVHERLVVPESRAEVLHGQVLWSAPADQPHGMKHFDLTAVLAAHVVAGYSGAVDMLTRTNHDSDFAPDASIFPSPKEAPEDRASVAGRGKKKKKGTSRKRASKAPIAAEERELEELAFEVVASQKMIVPTEKARELTRRGVRRVFAIIVGDRQVLEWSREKDDWVELPADSSIEDRCLVRPMAVAALLDAAARDDAVALALLAKNNRVLLRAREESRIAGLAEGQAAGRAEGQAEGQAAGRAEGQLQGKRDALVTILTARGLAPGKSARARITGCAAPDTLDRWITQAATATSVKQALRP